MTHFNNHQLQEIRLLLQQNRKVEAVKYVKDHSNLGLKESKDFVDQFENQAQFFNSEYAHQNTDDLNTPQPIQHHEVLSLIQQGRKIEAIKLVMDQSHLGLKDAKDFVEELAENPDLTFSTLNLTRIFISVLILSTNLFKPTTAQVKFLFYIRMVVKNALMNIILTGMILWINLVVEQAMIQQRIILPLCKQEPRKPQQMPRFTCTIVQAPQQAHW